MVNNQSDWIVNQDVDQKTMRRRLHYTVSDIKEEFEKYWDATPTTMRLYAIELLAETIESLREFKDERDITGKALALLDEMVEYEDCWGGELGDGTYNQWRRFADRQHVGDVIIHKIGVGRDVIYNYSDGDVISIAGAADISQSNFYNLGGGRMYMVYGNDTLTLMNATTTEIAVEHEGGADSGELNGIRIKDNQVELTLNYADYVIGGGFDGSDHNWLVNSIARSLERRWQS